MSTVDGVSKPVDSGGRVKCIGVFGFALVSGVIATIRLAVLFIAVRGDDHNRSGGTLLMSERQDPDHTNRSGRARLPFLVLEIASGAAIPGFKFTVELS